jgi:hypothetical protein
MQQLIFRGISMNTISLENLETGWTPYTEEFTNNSGQSGKIIARNRKSVIVQFYDTGSTRKALIDNVRVGKVRDPYAKSVYDVGYIGEHKKPTYYPQAKQLWQNMMKRCYSTKDIRGYAWKGTKVDDRWLCFSNFLEDLPKLDNFDLWLKGQKSGADKYNLDKDFKFPDNNVYSREACMFVTDFENKSAGGVNRQTKYKSGRV